MDITRNLFLRLDKDKIPPGLRSILYPGEKRKVLHWQNLVYFLEFLDEKDSVDTSISIDSVSSCLEVLQRYHETFDPSDLSRCVFIVCLSKSKPKRNIRLISSFDHLKFERLWQRSWGRRITWHRLSFWTEINEEKIEKTSSWKSIRRTSSEIESKTSGKTFQVRRSIV